MTTPPPSNVDNLANSLYRIERIGQNLAYRFGASHFSFYGTSREFWLVGGDPQLFPATCWEPLRAREPLIHYEKGILNLAFGYKAIMLRPAT